MPRRPARGPAPTLERERDWWSQGACVAGVDEVGRGAWAGPVTVAAVALEPGRRVLKLRDSKLLPPAERTRLATRLRGAGAGIGLGHASNHEIDRLGMSAALRLAARRAVDALPRTPEVCLIDGSWDLLEGYGTTNERLVGGDARCASIAAASIVAKVARDALMVAAGHRHPAYAFAANKGYPAPAHRAALAEDGPCGLHRHSWAPIVAARQARLPW
ncbi:MAG: ribonuclease HII [Actinomycetota bacterium]